MITQTEKQTEGIKSNEVFDIDKALNEKGFVEFLAKHPDAEILDMNDGEKISKRFDTFKSKETVKKELKNLYSNKIQAELGVKLEGNDLTAIDVHIEKQALENPDEIEILKDRISTFSEFPKVISELEHVINELGGAENLRNKLGELVVDANSLKDSMGAMGIVGEFKWAYSKMFSADTSDID